MPVIADIYGEALFRAYLMDEQTFLILFRRLYNREIKIENLLAYYDISLKNPKTIKIYEKRIEHAKKD